MAPERPAANAWSPESGGDEYLATHTIPNILVDEIQDWGQFQQKLTKTAKFQLPSAVLKAADLKIETWNNIPIPVVHSAKAYERCLINTSSIMIELVRELRDKTVKIVHKFKSVDREARRSAQAAAEGTAKTSKALTNRFQKLSDQSNALIETQQDKLTAISA